MPPPEFFALDSALFVGRVPNERPDEPRLCVAVRYIDIVHRYIYIYIVFIFHSRAGKHVDNCIVR